MMMMMVREFFIDIWLGIGFFFYGEGLYGFGDIKIFDIFKKFNILCFGEKNYEKNIRIVVIWV